MKKIQWAPVHVPPKRRLQTLAAGLYVSTVFGLPLASWAIIGALLYYGSYLWKALTVAYLGYIYYDHTHGLGCVMNGNGLTIYRNNILGRNLRDYFPIDLVKTVDLNPDRNYIIAAFPHGVICTGIWVNMGQDIKKWIELFPGIRPKIGTLDQNMKTPILRELLRIYGLVSVTKESLTYYLRKSNDPKHPDNSDGFTSNAIAIAVGGSQEALDSHPGKYILTLKNRKGFVKMAIRTGSAIVPSMSFGEVDVFDSVDNPPDSWLRSFQSMTKKLTNISPVVVMGRGFFQYSFGLLPQRRPIVQVVGAPIDVKQNDEPDAKYIDEIHEKFIVALTELFETHKSKYIQNAENTKLIIQ